MLTTAFTYSKKAKADSNIFFVVAIVILLLAVSGVFNGKLFSTLGPDEYVEYRCEDTTSYKANGYTFSSTDEHGCEIVQKFITDLAGKCNMGCEPGGCAWNPGSCLCACGPSYGGWSQGVIDSSCDFSCPVGHTDYRGGWKSIVTTCTYDAGDLIVVESFTGGQTITRSSTRYPIKGFCKAHPAIITDAITRTSSTSTVVYDQLLNNSPITIGTTQTLTLFYIIENNYQLPTYCSQGTAVSVNTCTQTGGVWECSCVPSLGIVYACSQGLYDPALGLCVVQPESTCSLGRLERHTNGTYYCVWNPPIQADCTPYGPTAYFSVNLNKCIYTPQIQYNCTIGTYNDVVGKCIYTPLANGSCPDDRFTREYINSQLVCTISPLIWYNCTGGGTYSSSTGKCTQAVNKTEYICPGVLSADKLTCYINPPIVGSNLCPVNTTYEHTLGVCIMNPSTQCPTNMTYDAATKTCMPSTGSLFEKYKIFIIFGAVIILALFLKAITRR